MTITNDERREVAENLRTMTVCGCRYKEQFYELLEETVMPEWEFHSFDTVAERLADLIEPEERTCRNEAASNDYFACSECGMGVDLHNDYGGFSNYAYGDWNYCPNCGAKIEQ